MWKDAKSHLFLGGRRIQWINGENFEFAEKVCGE
jgi:hypothetical protein